MSLVLRVSAFAPVDFLFADLSAVSVPVVHSRAKIVVMLSSPVCAESNCEGENVEYSFSSNRNVRQSEVYWLLACSFSLSHSLFGSFRTCHILHNSDYPCCSLFSFARTESVPRYLWHLTNKELLTQSSLHLDQAEPRSALLLSAQYNYVYQTPVDGQDRVLSQFS